MLNLTNNILIIYPNILVCLLGSIFFVAFILISQIKHIIFPTLLVIFFPSKDGHRAVNLFGENS